MAFIRERFKKRRLDMGLTLQEVADFLGVEKPTVQRYESGKIKTVDTLTVEKMSVIVKCSPAYLMGWTDEINESPKSNCNANCSSKEKRIIEAYREKPEVQIAVDRLLGIEECSEEFLPKEA